MPSLTAQEQQLYDLLSQKVGIPPMSAPPPAVPSTPQIDIAALNQMIDAKVAERMNSISPTLAKIAQPKENPMDKLVNPEKALLERLRPLIMRALTFEHKGRFAELAMNVRLNARSKDEAYRIGIDAFCDFLNTTAGREWIQVGSSAFLESVSQAADSASTSSTGNT
jgi:hypothetical protein